MLAAPQGFQRFQCPKVLHGQMVQHKPKRFLRLAIRAGINLKSVSCWENAARIGDLIGIQRGQRKLGMIEIIPPLQKAFQLIAVELHAQHPRPYRRHGHEGVGHIPILPHAVIRPESRYPGLQERFQMIDRYDGFFQCAGLIKCEIGKRVDHGPALKIRLDQRTGVTVAFQMIQRRLVGNVKTDAVRNAQTVQFFHQCRKECAQKTGVCIAVSVRLPAEQLLFLAVHRGHDLGGSRRTPLGKQVRHFQPGNPAAAANLHPPLQALKPEGILAAVNGYLHQLDGQPFPPRRGIQRRSKQRRQDHAAAPPHSRANEIFDDRPMRLAKHGNAVIFRQTVRVEPVGPDQLLIRKVSRQNGHRNAYRSQNAVIVR